MKTNEITSHSYRPRKGDVSIVVINVKFEKGFHVSNIPSTDPNPKKIRARVGAWRLLTFNTNLK